MLVVGGTSFVGSHLLPRLVSLGIDVSATRRPGHRDAGASGIRWIDSDLALPTAAAAWPSQIDTVIYLAQSRLRRNFPLGADDVFAVNVAGVFHAAEYARVAGARRFVVASTGSIYEAGLEPARESDHIPLTASRHFYVAAKACAELLLGAYRETMHVVALRLFVPYGAGQADDMLIPRLIQMVRSGQPIELDGEHGMRLNPVAIGDVVDTFGRALTLDASATLNVAGPHVLTLREVGEQIGSLVGRTPVFQQRGSAERALIGDTALLSATFNWAPATSFMDGLRSWI